MPKSALEYARIALKKTRDALCLGSTNIKKSSYDCHTDNPIIIQGLFSSNDTARRLRVEALLGLGIDKRFGAIKENIEFLSNKRLSQQRGLARSEDYQYNSKISRWKNDLNFSLIAQAGNCDELSLCALAMLSHEGYAGRSELVRFALFEHVFVILNRPPSASLADWKSWGKNTVIIEPWLNEVFTGDQFGKFWEKNIRIFLSEIPDHIPSIKEIKNIPDYLNLLEVKLMMENPFIENKPDTNPRAFTRNR